MQLVWPHNWREQIKATGWINILAMPEILLIRRTTNCSLECRYRRLTGSEAARNIYAAKSPRFVARQNQVTVIVVRSVTKNCGDDMLVIIGVPRQLLRELVRHWGLRQHAIGVKSLLRNLLQEATSSCNLPRLEHARAHNGLSRARSAHKMP